MPHNMVKKLTKLRIDEISSVDRGANEGAKIVLMKRDDHPQGALFNEIMLRKADVSDPLRGPREEPDDSKVSGTLHAMVDAMLVAAPTLDRQQAAAYLLHNPHGRRQAEHLNSISKTEKETTMPHIDITKLHNIDSVTEIAKNVIADKVALTEHQFTEILQGHAKIAGTTLEKILIGPDNGEIRKAYALVKGYQPAG
jgi:hypothetical protein